jgi:hypothetical protein
VLSYLVPKRKLGVELRGSSLIDYRYFSRASSMSLDTLSIPPASLPSHFTQLAAFILVPKTGCMSDIAAIYYSRRP